MPRRMVVPASNRQLLHMRIMALPGPPRIPVTVRLGRSPPVVRHALCLGSWGIGTSRAYNFAAGVGEIGWDGVSLRSTSRDVP